MSFCDATAIDNNAETGARAAEEVIHDFGVPGEADCSPEFRPSEGWVVIEKEGVVLTLNKYILD